jgi:putative endonuclease
MLVPNCRHAGLDTASRVPKAGPAILDADFRQHDDDYLDSQISASHHWSMNRQPAVYIMASDRNGTLYVGVTSDLMGRVYQHRTKAMEGFTARYDVNRLVWFQMCDTMEAAIQREKQLKNWRRKWKLDLIEAGNPRWRDLAEGLGFVPL